MHWEPPAQKNGKEIQYRVEYKPSWNRRYTKDETISLDGLKQCTNYTVYVKAVSEAGKTSHVAIAVGWTGVKGESN